MPRGEVQTQRAMARVGERHGMLVIKEFAGSDKNRRAVFVCVCDCGAEVKKDSGLLTDKSHCGCQTAERQRLANLKHGFSPRAGKSSISSIWSAMKKRCSNEKNRDFKWYGGKGISVCERWLKFENFLADMGGTYFEGATIDRIDPNGNYEPSNCRWLPHSENVKRASASMWERIKADRRNGKYRGG